MKTMTNLLANFFYLLAFLFKLAHYALLLYLVGFVLIQNPIGGLILLGLILYWKRKDFTHERGLATKNH